MGNYILLCHGQQVEFSSFEIPAGSEVIYWGAPGYLLTTSVAWTAISQIRKNPTDLESINSFFTGLPSLQDRTLIGSKTYAPDLLLSGDDNLLCIFINMVNNNYAILGSNWQIRLKNLTAALNNDLLHLLCCTGDSYKPDMSVLSELSVKDSSMVIPK